MEKVASIFSIWFTVINYHLFPPEQLLVGRRGWSINQGWEKEWFKRYLPNFRSDIMETELRTLKLFSRIILDKTYNNQSFPYTCHCKHYKKVASRLHSMLFTLTKFFLKHTLSSSEGKQKFALIAVFLSKLDHRPLFNGIYYETIPVWGLVSLWLTNATHCLV